MREVIYGAKAMPNEGGRPLSEWVVVPPAVQWALNTAWRKRLQATPYHVMRGREPRTAFTALIERDDEGFQFSPIDEDRLQQLVVSLVDAQEELLAGVLQRVDADRCHHRERSSRARLCRISRKAITFWCCLLYTSPSPRDGLLSRMPSSA